MSFVLADASRYKSCGLFHFPQGFGVRIRQFVARAFYVDVLPWIGFAEALTVAYAYGECGTFLCAQLLIPTTPVIGLGKQ